MASDEWLRGKGDGLKADIPVPIAFTIPNTGEAAKAIEVTRVNKIAIINWVNQSAVGVRAVASPDGIVLTSAEHRAHRVALMGDRVVITAKGDVYAVHPTLFAAMFAIAPRKKRRSYAR